jgi:hypothetical protein
VALTWGDARDGQAGREVRAGTDRLVMLSPSETSGTTCVYLALRTEPMLADFDDFTWDWHSADDE